MKEWINLDDIFNAEQWESLQESLAGVTEMALITVNYKGIPITNHSGCHEFCKRVRAHPALSKCCQRCDSRGGLEAVRCNEPYIYQCYFSIVDIAIPIIVNNKYLGAIMAGQVRLPPENSERQLEQIFFPVDQELIKKTKADWRENYDKIPFLSYERIQVIANMLFYLCNYMVKEALRKKQIIDMYETVFQGSGSGGFPPEQQDGVIETVKIIKNAMSNAIVNASVNGKEPKSQNSSSNSIIVKAFEYIYSHKGESPSLIKMADYCHVSSSYLSRLFSKEVGESYSSFVTKLKVEWAKEMLESSSMSIYEISCELGFSEAGYFIKIFKKYVGVTPALYRSYCKAQ